MADVETRPSFRREASEGGGTINERLGGRKVGTQLREMSRKTSWLRTEARTEEEEGEEEMCVLGSQKHLSASHSRFHFPAHTVLPSVLQVSPCAERQLCSEHRRSHISANDRRPLPPCTSTYVVYADVCLPDNSFPIRISSLDLDLQSGDRVQLGNYTILVRLRDANVSSTREGPYPFIPPPSLTYSHGTPSSLSPLASSRFSQIDGLRKRLCLSSFSYP